MKTRKAYQRIRVYMRLETALQDLYHNATPKHPYIESKYEAKVYDDWFGDTAAYEIEYMQSGGAYPKNNHKSPL